jgi:hypothetical protein
MAFGTVSTIIMSATTNLNKTGTFTIEPPIEGMGWQWNTQEGWSNACDNICPWPLSVPLDPHLYNLTNANYLTTLVQPYNPVTMIPPAGSAAINAGSALTGLLQTMPVRWQYSTATNSLIPRLNPQTIGAVDFAPEAVTPTFSPSAGDYTTAPTVTLETTTPSASIYYTTDGSTPTYPATGTTQLYSGPITVSTTETLQAIAIATGYIQSNVASAAYGVGAQAATPNLSPAGGTYTAVQTVTISDATAGATVYYTIDGSTPSSGSPVYSGPISVSTNEVVQALATAPGYSNSNMASASYTINIPQTPLPAFTPAAGNYTSAQTVAITDSAAGSAIYYTTNGSAPTAASTPYTGPITVSATELVEAIAIAPGDSPSTAAKAAYSITAPFTGPAVVQQCNNFEQYSKTISCTLSGVGAGHTLVIGIANLWTGQTGTATSSSGAPVLATTDGNTLSAWVLTNTSAGSNKITYTVAQDTRLWLSVVEYGNTATAPLDGVAEAVLSTWQPSGTLNTPDFTTSAASDALWSLCSANGAAPTVGTAPAAWTALPTPTNGDLLVESGDAGAAGTYFGQCSGANEGEIVSLALMPASALAQAATPTFSIASGTYNSAQSVTISDSTPGTTIYYTTNGVAPTTGSSVYSGAITVSASETVEAIAVSSTTTQSAVASATYTIGTSGTAPSITWVAPAAITYGTALSATQLNATSTVAGTFSYSPAAGTVLAAGSQTLTVTFTPTNTTAYTTATGSVTLTVNKAIPIITWTTPASISVGAALSATQLNAASTVAGSFSYSPSLGTVLAAGSQTLNAIFTPTNSTDYSTATASVTLAVIPSGAHPAYVQQCNQYVQSGATATCRLSGVGAGHSLVIGVAESETLSGKVTASAGTPTLVVNDGSHLSAYLLANTGGGNILITFTATGNTRIYLTVEEYANTAVAPLDGSASVVEQASSSTISTPKFSTTTANDLLWSFCAAPEGAALTPGKEPFPWTARTPPVGAGDTILVEDGLTTNPGTYYGQVTGPSATWEIVTLALKP